MEQRKFLRRILLTCIGFLLTVCAFAQQITVQGQVKDTAGEPIIGANVIPVGNTKNGTITDINGNFKVKAEREGMLTISFVGYKTTTVRVSQNMVITLQDDSKILNDIVVIGYGTVKKSDATGSVVSVKADQLNKGPDYNHRADIVARKNALRNKL